MVTPSPRFRTDLYRGTAAYYDRYRPPYPEPLFDDLCQRLPLEGQPRVLDLACGTGQIAFPLAGRAAQVLAVDQEEESVRFGRARAHAGGVTNIAWLVGSAETLALRRPVELIAVGNAFHRLNRERVAERMRSWVSSHGAVALLWAETPTQGDQLWQKTLEDLYTEWMTKARTADRIPAGWATAIEEDPHDAVLHRAGFDYDGKFEFTAEHTWTIHTLIGFTYTTSFLNRRALGNIASAFERDLTERLSSCTDDGTFRQMINFSYELARVRTISG